MSAARRYCKQSRCTVTATNAGSEPPEVIQLVVCRHCQCGFADGEGAVDIGEVVVVVETAVSRWRRPQRYGVKLLCCSRCGVEVSNGVTVSKAVVRDSEGWV